MQNDVLKNEIAPWMEKGRWYHGVIDLSTNSWVADETDEYLNSIIVYTVSTVGLALYPDSSSEAYLDAKCIPRGKITPTTAFNFTVGQYRVATSGNLGIIIAPLHSSVTSGILDVYVYRVKFK